MREKEQVRREKTGEDERGSFVAVMQWLFEFALMLVVAFGLAYAVRTWLIQPYQVPTSSMTPTIEVGDHILANKLVYLTSEPQVGDIVVVDDPTGEVDTLVKRVIAVGGQTVDLEDGHVVVDGEIRDEPYTHGLPSEPQVVEMPYTVPEGEVWLMGDNRTNSKDSRTFGSVPVESVRGKAVAVYWPLSRIGSLSQDSGAG